MTTWKPPLSGLRVVELAGRGPGPFGAMMLDALGADVLRIERPDPDSVYQADPMASGRPRIALNLKDPAGRTVLKRLLARSDVLMESYRPGALERLGIAPAELSARYPHLVLARMTGWGQEGPLASAPGHDINYLAITGALHAMGDPDRPPPVPLNLVADFGAGGMLLVTGILAAVLERERTGLGQILDVAMVDGVAQFMTIFHAWIANGMWSLDRGNNILDGAAPYYRTYACSDGFVAVGAIEPIFFTRLLDLVGLTAEEYGDRDERSLWPNQRALLADRFAGRTRAEWAAMGTDACVTPVLDLSEAPTHPHALARSSYRTANGQTRPCPAPRFGRTPTTLTPSTRASAAIDDATRHVLQRAGLSSREIDLVSAYGADSNASSGSGTADHT